MGRFRDQAFVLIYGKIGRLRHLELYFALNDIDLISYSNSIPRSLRNVCRHDIYHVLRGLFRLSTVFIFEGFVSYRLHQYSAASIESQIL